jgi:hypothetical protein
MAKLLCKGEDIGFTILPYSLDTPVQEELLGHPSDYVLGYITYNNDTGDRTFTYTESGKLVEADHWSLSILKEFPYCEQNGPWIVYRCSPAKTKSEFGKILEMTHESLHIENWDTWSVEGKDAKVVVVTSWEIF